MATIHDGPSAGQRVLVTGIGRSGTKYMSELLTAAGLPCGHEDLFTPLRPWCSELRLRAPQALEDWGARAESSWYAAPWAKLLRDHGLFVVHVVRDPRAWLASWVLTVWPRTRKSAATRDFLARALPSLRGSRRTLQGAIDADPIGTAQQLWLDYNEIAGAGADARLAVENVEAPTLAMLAGCSSQKATAALSRVRRDVNRRAHGDLSLTPKAQRWPVQARSLAAAYGYEL